MRFVAGRGAVAERHREDVAGRGAVAERLQRGGAVAELLAGALRRRAIRKMLLARGAAVAEILLAGARRRSWLAGAPWQRCCCQGDPSGRGEKACEKEKQHLRRTCTYPAR